jgi:DnaJ homolog subfamily B member 4
MRRKSSKVCTLLQPQIHPQHAQLITPPVAEISQAYEILSDPEKRKTYDLYGLEFILRGGAPPPQGADGGGMPDFSGFAGGGAGGNPFASAGGMPGGGSRTFHFSTGSGGASGFQFSDPESIFADFFRGAGDDGMGGMPGGFGGLGGFQNMRSPGGRSQRRSSAGRGFEGMNGGPRAPTPEVTVLEKPLPVTLEEIFKGTTKKMKIKRKKFDQASLKQTTEDRILEVPIKPGLKAGSKIKFKDVGDQVEGGTQDLHFIVEEVCLRPPSVC